MPEKSGGKYLTTEASSEDSDLTTIGITRKFTYENRNSNLRNTLVKTHGFPECAVVSKSFDSHHSKSSK